MDLVMVLWQTELRRFHWIYWGMSKSGSANFFCKESDSMYFRLCRPVSLSQLFSSAFIAQKHPETSYKQVSIAELQ